MALTRKPIPKSQIELSQDTIEPYLNQGKAPVPANKRRENQRSVKNDNVKQFTVGLKDVDESIFFYFNNVIRPSVIQNSTKINVPVLYGSPERWASMQKDGFYRDNNGKIQTPLIMVKRESIEKNRSLGNKMDANNPIHFGVFQKKYSKKNVYDHFSTLNDRIPVKEYYGVIMPDYINLVYTCVVFTEYVEQMNKIIESVNFASDSYWGDPERFKFRAAIDNYTTTTELVDGGDRTVKTSFQIKIAGYIVSDAINTSVGNPNKFFSKAAVKFGLETAGTTEILNARAGTPTAAAPSRFFDTALTGVAAAANTYASSGMTPEQIAFVGISNTALADLVSHPTATFNNHSISVPPSGFAAPVEKDFQVYINGVMIPKENRTTSNSGANITVTFNDLGFTLDSTDQVVLVGKFS
ncbi:hypothetical protein UFOVP54_34 [uncultured Caudovirales phage]|uniref:Uncharacterized protein n=1 Tax=uncultured Caudovirales phage TaxID=2100421 RepID=A0A6J5KY28_9CAUD|nr:hypothetical protein UFOVP54_34 [uncultured Caudovirales phage]